MQLIKKQRKTHYPLLIFVSEIELGQQFTEDLKNTFQRNSSFVSSQTTDRLRMVEEFRNRAITMLVSTTILERGVTFPFVDVFVLESNHKLFTKSALVQISGRVGRSKERPTGKLLFSIRWHNTRNEESDQRNKGNESGGWILKECLLCTKELKTGEHFTDLIFMNQQEEWICKECKEDFEQIGEIHCPRCYKDKEEKVCKDCEYWIQKGEYSRT